MINIILVGSFYLNNLDMDKETLLTGFKKELGEPSASGYLGDTGVTMRTLDKYVEALLPTITTDDSVNEQFFKNQAAVVKAMGGQMRFEQAEFVKNYKPKPGTVPPEPPADPKQKTGEPGNEDVLKRLEALEKERENDRKNSVVREMRSRVSNKSGELKVTNKNLWEDTVRMVEYKDGMDDAAMEAKAKELYESKLKAYMGEGASPYGGSPSGSHGQDDKALDDFFNRKVLEGKFPGKK